MRKIKITKKKRTEKKKKSWETSLETSQHFSYKYHAIVKNKGGEKFTGTGGGRKFLQGKGS
jgi:hypothetical protein